MNRLIAMLLLLAFALALPTTGRLTAQQEPVGSVQELARTKFRELHDRMQKLQVLLQRMSTRAMRRHPQTPSMQHRPRKKPRSSRVRSRLSAVCP